jgi:putative transposase
MVGPVAKREGVAHLQVVMGLSERRACSIVDADRKMIRYCSRRAPDTELRTQLRDLANARRRFGYRRLFILLRQDGEPSGINRIYRLYREEGLTVLRRSHVAPPAPYGVKLIRSPKTGPFKARVFRDIFPWLEERKTMKASQFSDAQKAFILKQGNDGVPVADICRKAGISQATYFNWKKKYDGMQPPEMRRLKQLEDENARLKKIVADLSLDREMLQDVIRRKI